LENICTGFDSRLAGLGRLAGCKFNPLNFVVMYQVILSCSGLAAGRPFVFIPARLRRSFGKLSEAQKYYTRIATKHHFKPSKNYGVFLSIVRAGEVIQRQQIN